MIGSLLRFAFIVIDIVFVTLVIGWQSSAVAADLVLSWHDNSDNETGFKIDRKTGTNGTFAQIASVGANNTSYSDTGLSAGTTFCYRVRAYNSAGSSAYTPEACKTTPSIAFSTFNFSIAHGGNKSVTQNQSVSNVITATLISGSSQSVSFSTSVPPGTSVSYSTSSSCNPSCSRTLNLATSSSTPIGTHQITVFASGGGVTKSTSFSLTVTSESIAEGGGSSNSTITREAESGNITAPMVIRSDESASGELYVEVPEGNGSNYNDGSYGGPGEIRFVINISQSKSYALWARTIAPNNTSDSFYVTRNGSLITEWHVPQSTSWKWNKVEDLYLEAGTANLAFRQREDGTKLDQIALTSDSNFIPGSTPPPAPSFNFSLVHGGNKSVTKRQSVSNVITATLISGSPQSVYFSASGLPSGTTASFTSSSSCTPTCSRTMNLATSPSTPSGTHQITVNATGGGVTKITSFSLTVASGSSGGGSGDSDNPIILEAESGNLTAPMAIRSDSAAYGGLYVEVPEGSGSNGNDETNGGPGEVRFAINISQSGTYALWARTIAPDGNSDSFYVTRNGTLVIEWHLWPNFTSWQWNKVEDVYLGVGIGNIAFRQREDGTKLDRILLTRDPGFVPD